MRHGEQTISWKRERLFDLMWWCLIYQYTVRLVPLLFCRLFRDDLITAFKIFEGPSGIDPNLVFLPPVRRGLKGHPFKVLQGASRRRRRGSAFSVRVVKYWNKLPASVVAAPSVYVFKKRLEVWTEVFPHPPKDWTLTPPRCPTPPPSPPAHHPSTVIMSIGYQTPCLIYLVSSGPLWPTFYHYNS